MRRLIPALLTALMTAKAGAQTPDAARGAEPPGLEQARELLSQAAKAEDPAAARAFAARAAAGLDAAVQALPADSPDCWLFAATAEAHLRAGDPKGARPSIERGAIPACDAAAFAGLSAWAHEYAPDGTRRGPGAELAASVALYLRAAELYREREDSADAVAAALASAAELALMVDDAAMASRAGLAGLKARPSRDLAIRCGVVALAAASPGSGEGAATDGVSAAVGDDLDLLRDILDARVAQVGAGLDAKPSDPYLLAAAGFYSLLRGDDVGVVLARRHLEGAAASGLKLPELSYLRGRLAHAMNDEPTARTMWRRQQADFPTGAASRLAANDLALSLADTGGEPGELEQALRALDAWIGRDDDAALHESKARLLKRMGRRDEAVAAMERAQQMEPTPERAAELKSLRQPG